MALHYYLESSGKATNLPRHLHLERFPATVGRHSDCTIQLAVERISRTHARFELRGDTLMIEDLGSTNGTFVNHELINAATELSAGDIVHLADHEFRIMADRRERGPQTDPRAGETMIGISSLPRDFPLHMPAFIDLLDNQRVTGHCQPIVTADGELCALELLGRSTHPELDQGPGQLFALARALDAEVRLSRMLRRTLFAQAHEAGLECRLFFNNHPTECEDLEALLAELAELREQYPDLALVFEVHESAVTDLELMASVRRELRAMDIELAYDDFGAGQARLLELVEVPPDYLKFDISLVRDLDHRDSPRYRMLTDLNNMIADMGIQTLVEGVERPETVELCREIGIDLYQGFHFGRPRPILSGHS